ncbi:hypothetical protein CUMW_165050 [Citrus unshiu]|nr:hypothetical protein CUMW_165050 [Citrus unshiu]
MEITRQSFFSQTKLLSCSTTSLSPPPPPPPSIFRSKASLLVSSNSVPFHSSRTLLTQLQGLRIKAKKHRNLGAIRASEADSSTTTTTTSTDVAAERWLLQPVGDGDTSHIGFKVPMPDAFEIASVISGLHARIQKKGDSLLVTDLDSTNGTFIDEKRLRSGVVAVASPGSRITFGDTHLAMFRVSKIDTVEAPSKTEESEEKGDSPPLSSAKS